MKAAELDARLMSWSEEKEKLRTGKITKEEYDRWHYHYPAFDDSMIKATIPPDIQPDVEGPKNGEENRKKHECIKRPSVADSHPQRRVSFIETICLTITFPLHPTTTRKQGNNLFPEKCYHSVIKATFGRAGYVDP